MFPPTPKEAVEEWVSEMWGFLQRAAPQWSEEATIEEHEEGLGVYMFLTDPILPKNQKMVGRLMRDYAKASGWELKKILMKPSYVFFVVDKS